MSGLDVSTRPVERSAETTTTETTTIEIVSLRATGIAVGLPLALLAAVALSATSGVGLAITSTAALVALATEAGLRSSAAQLCLVTVSLVPWLVVRDNTWLAMCIVATVGLVLVLAAVAAATQQRIGDLSFGAVFRRHASTRPSVVAPGSDLVWSMLRGVAFAIPVVGVFWTFLAAADDVFAAVVDPSRIPSSRVLLFIVLAPTLMAVSKFASDGRSSRPARTSFVAGRFGVVESSIVLGAVSLLFGVFITLRLATLNRPIDPEAWRSEVRSGFFQLLWVAALTVLLVLAVRQASGPGGLTGRVRVLGWLTIGLAAVIDALALVRIAQYVDVTFLSPLRFWSFGFGIWLFVLLALAAVRLTSVAAGTKWFTAAALASWMTFLLVFAVINPDQRIAQHNFDAFDPTVEVADGEPRWVAVRLLSWLSEDATVVIADNLETLRPMPNTRYERMLDHLCSQADDASWRDWNLSRAKARSAIKDRC